VAFFKFIDFEYRIFNVEIDRGFEICVNGIDPGEAENRYEVSLDCGLIERSVASMMAIRVSDPAVWQSRKRTGKSMFLWGYFIERAKVEPV
jgi:hypothetical protein